MIVLPSPDERTAAAVARYLAHTRLADRGDPMEAVIARSCATRLAEQHRIRHVRFRAFLPDGEAAVASDDFTLLFQGNP